MSYKKFVVGITLSTLFFFPNSSFSNIMIGESRKGIYIGSQYKVGIPNFSNFSAEETIPGVTEKVLAYMEDENRNDIPYNPMYDNFVGFNGVIGYCFDGVRIEFEGSYVNFEPAKQWSTKKQNHKLFALSRKSNGAVILENSGVNNKSVNINLCYDIAHGNIPLAPYACVAVGADYIRFLNTSLPKFSYQIKFGVNYPINANTMLFGGGYYHGVIGNKYKRVAGIYYNNVMLRDDAPKITSASATLNTDYFGLEVGIRFLFLE